MKKTLSAVLAASMALSMGATAFAATLNKTDLVSYDTNSDDVLVLTNKDGSNAVEKNTSYDSAKKIYTYGTDAYEFYIITADGKRINTDVASGSITVSDKKLLNAVSLDEIKDEIGDSYDDDVTVGAPDATVDFEYVSTSDVIADLDLGDLTKVGIETLIKKGDISLKVSDNGTIKAYDNAAKEFIGTEYADTKKISDFTATWSVPSKIDTKYLTKAAKADYKDDIFTVDNTVDGDYDLYKVSVKSVADLDQYKLADWSIEVEYDDYYYSVKGKNAYSAVREVEGESRYTNTKTPFNADIDDMSGTIYNFNAVIDEQAIIKVDDYVKVYFDGNYGTDVENLKMSTATIDAVEDLFDNDADIDYYTFEASPKFASAVTVKIYADPNAQVYAYDAATGDIANITDEYCTYTNDGYEIEATKLTTFVLTEEVYEDGNTTPEVVAPEEDTDVEVEVEVKPNPGTGAF